MLFHQVHEIGVTPAQTMMLCCPKSARWAPSSVNQIARVRDSASAGARQSSHGCGRFLTRSMANNRRTRKDRNGPAVFG